MFKKMLFVPLAALTLTGCPFDNDSNPSRNPDGSTPAPTSSPAPSSSANPTASPTANPTSGPTASPTAAPSSGPTPTPGSGSGDASACYNPELLQQGTQTTLSYKSTDGDSNEVLTFTDERMVTGPATFKGQQTILTDGTTQSSSSVGSYTTQTKTYNTVQSSTKGARTYGLNTTTTVQGFTTTTEAEFSPYSEMRFNLSAGQSFVTEYSLKTTTDTGGFGNVTTNTNHKDTITFVGLENVSVPAGTFETCRFDTSSVVTGDSSSTENATNWFDVGSGVLIKNQAGNDKTEFTSGSVNGTAVQ